MFFFSALSYLFFTSNSAVLLVGRKNNFAPGWYPSYVIDKIIGEGGLD